MSILEFNADEYLSLSIARIYSGRGSPVGAGFLVSRRELLTCAHVITKALNISESSSRPTAEITLDFPLFSQGEKFTAKVTNWQIPQPDGGGDIAILKLNQAPPQRLYKAILVTSRSLLKVVNFEL